MIALLEYFMIHWLLNIGLYNICIIMTHQQVDLA